MIIRMDDENNYLLGEADNGWPLYSSVCFTPQNEIELKALIDFVESFGYTVNGLEETKEEKE